MDPTLTIGRLAEEVGLPVSTLRYYERRGLITPSGRSRGNYRIYTADTVKRLRFIRAAQSSGFTLDDVETLVRFRDGGASPCDVLPVIEKRLAGVKQKLRELREVQSVLLATRGLCLQSGEDDCRVVSDLNRRAFESRAEDGRKKT